MEAVIFVFVACWFLIVANIIVKTAHLRKPTISSDGHTVSPNEDLTCERVDGHVHSESSTLEQEYGKRYIVHNEPENGYVILNGVKRKLKDCSKY